MKVRLTARARAYLRKEAAYLRQHSRPAAEAFVERIGQARQTLARFPEIGFGPDRLPIPRSHRLVVGEYLIDYDVSVDAVVINSIRHGAQDGVVPDDDDDDYEG